MQYSSEHGTKYTDPCTYYGLYIHNWLAFLRDRANGIVSKWHRKTEVSQQKKHEMQHTFTDIKKCPQIHRGDASR